MDERLIPPRYRVLSGSALKVIATLSMFVDHAATVVPPDLGNKVLFSLLGKTFTPYYLMNAFGRIAFPIFCFLLVEGFLHTHDRKAYGTRLALFALISEVPWNLWHTGKMIWLGKQSVFVTLAFAYLGLCLLERHEESDDAQQRKRLLVAMVALFAVMALARCDYGVKGLGCTMALYLLRTKPVPRFIVGSSCLGSPVWGSFAFLPIGMYNGKRGFIKGRALQMLFYVVYPAHMLLLWRIRMHMFG